MYIIEGLLIRLTIVDGLLIYLIKGRALALSYKDENRDRRIVCYVAFLD